MIYFFRSAAVVFFLLTSILVWGQESKGSYLHGQITSLGNSVPLFGVHVINLSTLKGTTSDQSGFYKLSASVGDTIFFSNMGFQGEKVSVTQEMLLVNKGYNLSLLRKNYDLDEVILLPYNLTGVFEVDIKSLDPLLRERIIKLKEFKTSEDLSSETSASIMSPVDYLYNIFGSHGKQLKKLKALEESGDIASMMESKYDRELLRELLGITKEELEELLIYCDYTPDFVVKSTDLEMLKAVQDCYENYLQQYPDRKNP